MKKPVPIAQPPFPLPAGVRVPLYFTIQPGGAYLSSVSGTPTGARLYYPNSDHMPPGSHYNFWNYNADPDASGWYIYGGGTVDPTGVQVIPDPGVQVYEFTGAMVVNISYAPLPAPPPVSTCGGDPVECSLGLMLESHTDFFLPDVIPIQLTRTYRTLDGQTRQFGKGMSDNYDLFLIGDGSPTNWPTWAAVVMPDGAWVYYNPTNKGGVLLCQENSGIFYGSVLAEDTNTTNLWSITLKNGTILSFPVSYNGINSAQAGLLRIEDRYGNQLLIYRDTSGFMTKITSPHGRYLNFSRPNGTTLIITDNFGRQVTYGFDANQNLITVKDAKGGVTTYSYTYNPTFYSFQLDSIKDPRGNYPVSNLQYDTCGRVIQETQGDGVGLWKFGYVPYLTSQPCYPIKQTTITDPRGYQKQLTFDNAGFVTQIVDALNQPEQQTTTIDREETYKTYLINSITDQLGRKTAYTYDGLANVKSVSRLAETSSPVTTSYTYDPHFWQLATVTDPLLHKWTINYDSTGSSPISIVDPLLHTITLNVTSGLLNWVADPLGNTTHFYYNSYSDLHEIIDPLGNITYRNTDTAGRVTSIEDPLRNTTTFGYDNLDHLTSISDAAKPTAGVTYFTYDGNENLLTVEDALGATHTTTYGYDTMNRRVSRKDALGKSESYEYVDHLNLTKYTDRDGNYVNYTYDGLNRRKGASTCCGSQDNITYTWDGGDRLTQATDFVAGTITRTPDDLDRLMKEVTPQGTVSYTYDNADRRATMTVAGQTAVIYTFDIANRLTQISQSGVGTVGFQYDDADRRTLLTLPNGATQAYVYDNGAHGDSHVTALTYKHGTTTIGNLNYTYDPDGRRSSVGGSLAAVYIPAAVTPNSFNADNEMTLFDSSGNRTVLSYDSNGQMTGDQIDTYTWDTRRHMSAISGYDTASFVYDALGRRASKTVNGVTTQFVYDGLNPVQELSGSKAVIANTLTGLNTDEFFTRTEPGCCGPLSYLTDALGSTQSLADSSGTVQAQYEYEPFGNTGTPTFNVNTTNS